MTTIQAERHYQQRGIAIASELKNFAIRLQEFDLDIRDVAAEEPTEVGDAQQLMQDLNLGSGILTTTFNDVPDLSLRGILPESLIDGDGDDFGNDDTAHEWHDIVATLTERQTARRDSSYNGEREKSPDSEFEAFTFGDSASITDADTADMAPVDLAALSELDEKGNQLHKSALLRKEAYKGMSHPTAPCSLSRSHIRNLQHSPSARPCSLTAIVKTLGGIRDMVVAPRRLDVLRDVVSCDSGVSSLLAVGDEIMFRDARRLIAEINEVQGSWSIDTGQKNSQQRK